MTIIIIESMKSSREFGSFFQRNNISLFHIPHMKSIFKIKQEECLLNPDIHPNF